MSLASVVGAFAVAQLNTTLDKDIFGMLLGGFVLLTGLIIVIRQRMGLTTVEGFDLESTRGGFAMVGIGLLVGLPGGLLGVRGPVLAVPLLVVLGVPMLSGVALAQVQSIFISAFATFGYALQGAIDWKLAILVGTPLLIGTVSGWWLARRINPERLKLVLALVLLALGAYLLLGGGTPT